MFQRTNCIIYLSVIKSLTAQFGSNIETCSQPGTDSTCSEHKKCERFRNPFPMAGQFYVNQCVCKDGFYTQGLLCEDKDECTTNQNRCNVYTETCINTIAKRVVKNDVTLHKFYNFRTSNSTIHKTKYYKVSPNMIFKIFFATLVCSYKCDCKDGYTKPENAPEGTSCTDKNECLEPNICGGKSHCVNMRYDESLKRGYRCRCFTGYQLDESSYTCQNIDECSARTDECDNVTNYCNDLDGSYECLCQPGYQRFGRSKRTPCSDIDECKLNPPCDLTTSTCVNTQGSYECACKEGFEKSRTDPDKCVDINECLQPEEYPCDSRTAICKNLIGSYECECKEGYENLNFNGICNDIDECQQISDQNSVCHNTPGSYYTTCIDGFKKSANGNCRNINECQGANVCPEKSECEDTIGSYVCKCRAGYEMDNELQECININECELPDTCSDYKGQVCEDLNPPYFFECHCPKGYKKDPRKKECVKILDCPNSPCIPPAICDLNMKDTATPCTCPDGTKTKGRFECTDIDECREGTHNCDVYTEDCVNIDKIENMNQQGYRCEVRNDEPTNGPDFDRNRPECANLGHQCPNSKSRCVEDARDQKGYRCKCDACYSGEFCQFYTCTTKGVSTQSLSSTAAPDVKTFEMKSYTDNRLQQMLCIGVGEASKKSGARISASDAIWCGINWSFIVILSVIVTLITYCVYRKKFEI